MQDALQAGGFASGIAKSISSNIFDLSAGGDKRIMVNPNPCDFDMEKPTLWSDIAKEGSPASKLMKVLELNKGFIDMKSRNLNEAMADHVHWQGAHGAISGWTWSSDAPTALEDFGASVQGYIPHLSSPILDPNECVFLPVYF